MASRGNPEEDESMTMKRAVGIGGMFSYGPWEPPKKG
jgi:hypothetical protein